MRDYKVRLPTESMAFQAADDASAVDAIVNWDGVAAINIRESGTDRLVWTAQTELVQFRAYWVGDQGSLFSISDRDAIDGFKNWPGPLPDRIEEFETGRVIWEHSGATPDLWRVVICLPGVNLDYYILWVGEPPMEEIQRIWELGGSRTQVRPRGWPGPLAEAYPGLASIAKLKVHGKGRLSQ